MQTNAINTTADLLLEDEERKKENQFLVFIKKMLRRKEAVVGFSVLVILAVLSIVSPLFTKYSYSQLGDLRHDIVSGGFPVGRGGFQVASGILPPLENVGGRRRPADILIIRKVQPFIGPCGNRRI